MKFTKVMAHGHPIGVGELPGEWKNRIREEFETLWGLHPPELARMRMGSGNIVTLPRWQQAFDREYRYPGSLPTAVPCPEPFKPYLEFVQGFLPGMNGILANWYDVGLGHYIGPHVDSQTGLSPHSPILTLSMGDKRVFRISRKGCKSVDTPVDNGTMVLIPWETNLHVMHSVPKATKAMFGRRISLTFRMFRD